MLMSRLSSLAHKFLMLMFINMFTENPWTGNFEGELNTLNPIIFTERRPGTSRTTENKRNYYMALSHKDWELPNSRIWLAEMDIDRGLDFQSHLDRQLDRQLDR